MLTMMRASKSSLTAPFDFRKVVTMFKGFHRLRPRESDMAGLSASWSMYMSLPYELRIFDGHMILCRRPTCTKASKHQGKRSQPRNRRPS